MSTTTPADTVVDRVLNFWFGPSQDRYDISADRADLWFKGGPDIDKEIKTKFGADVDAALAGSYDGIIGGPKGLRGDLAIVVLLDQFTRNIHRKSPKAFSGDAKALTIALGIMDNRMDEVRTLRVVERTFLMTPLIHSEILAVQNRCVGLQEDLKNEMIAAGEKAKEVVPMAEYSVKFAKEHRDIIEKFGRFPHRNEALGRTSTLEELEFLKNGPRYGQ